MWTQHWMSNNVWFSPGIATMREELDAFWLVDAIASHLTTNPAVIRERKRNPRFDALHFWKLLVRPDKTATLSCVEDSGMSPVVVQELQYTDYPEGEYTFYVGNDGPGTPTKIFLPEEY